MQSFDDYMLCNHPCVELDESVVKLDRTGKFPLLFQILLTDILVLRRAL